MLPQSCDEIANDTRRQAGRQAGTHYASAPKHQKSELNFLGLSKKHGLIASQNELCPGSLTQNQCQPAGKCPLWANDHISLTARQLPEIKKMGFHGFTAWACHVPICFH